MNSPRSPRPGLAVVVLVGAIALGGIGAVRVALDDGVPSDAAAARELPTAAPSVASPVVPSPSAAASTTPPTDPEPAGHRPISFGVHPDEAITLGPTVDGSVVLTGEVVDADGTALASVTVDDVFDVTQFRVSSDAVAVRWSYPTPAGGVPAVAWEQPLDDGAWHLARQPWRGTRPEPADGITLAWQYTGDSARYRREVDAAPGLTITAPFRYFLGRSGSLSGGADAAFIADMHARGLEVWPTIYTGGADNIRAALSDPARRSAHARAISEDARRAGADGVNIDIEGFELGEAEAVTLFVEELAPLVAAWGGVTSFDFTTMTDTWITPPPGYEFWSTGPDRARIGAAVDYSVLMAYDEFNRFRPSGPVASEAWVEEGLRYQLRFVDPANLLLGVPLYGRVWDGDTPRAVGIGTTERYVAEGVLEMDDRFGIERVTLPDGRVTWAETVARLQHRVDLVKAYGLAGTASWRLGFDTPTVWDVLPLR